MSPILGLSAVLDLVFPRLCPVCESVLDRAEGSGLCGGCSSEIELLGERAQCVCCGTPFGYESWGDEYGGDDSHLCGKCIKGQYIFNKARSVAFYRGKLRELLHGFKYEGKLGLSEILSRVLVDNYPVDFEEIDLVVPVPLHITKLREREFNQSHILAKSVGRELGVPTDPFLLRKLRPTRPQFEIKNEAERKRNVRGAFEVSDKGRLDGRSVLLLDDVITTGSTTNECARMLKGNGAKIVNVFSLLRATAL